MSVIWALAAEQAAQTPREGLEVLITQLVPLGALFFGTGLIREEIEDQTLTYAFSAPIGRHWIYGARVAAVALPLALLAAPPLIVFFIKAHDVSATMCISAALFSSLGYCGIFGILGQVAQRPTWFGLLYLLIWESGASRLPGFFSRLTYTHHLQTLMGMRAETSRFGALTDSTTVSESLIVLIVVTSVGLVGGGLLAAKRSFYLKK